MNLIFMYGHKLYISKKQAFYSSNKRYVKTLC
ncbi:hypothetical protein M2326_000769 [Flavobacterium sp. 7A]|nr:hypothetical protein [Flavobacterium sp. 7A]